MKIFYLLTPALLLATAAYAQAPSDSTAIKQVLEKESATWRAGDVAGHAQCWHLQPYSR
ncbi:MAG: endo-arabinase, partial [Cytophagaceae bacterium]